MPLRPHILAGLCLAGLLSPAAAQAQGTGLYLRGGIGGEWSRATRLHDIDCARTQPPALFGCGPGIDGRPLGARGDFGRSAALDLGIGYRFLPALRGEALLTYRPGFAFSGRANFLATPGPQPVSAELDTVSAMAVGYLDLPGLGLPKIGPVEPYVGGGVGLARHDIGRVIFAFPGLSANATTVIRGGESTRFAYMLAAGGAMRLSERLVLDVAYRYTDLGSVRTQAGRAVITRRTFTRALDIAGTEAELAAHGVAASLRVEF
ncbi:MAG: outer membrane beta-barrel protein [Pseudomonadota bacterium]|nr:outer membrane beta-barrel protein [Pseudomonadota bacterium]